MSITITKEQLEAIKREYKEMVNSLRFALQTIKKTYNKINAITKKLEGK